MVPGTLPVTIPHFFLAVFIPSLLKESEYFLYGIDRGRKDCDRELRGIFLILFSLSSFCINLAFVQRLTGFVNNLLVDSCPTTVYKFVSFPTGTAKFMGFSCLEPVSSVLLF